MLFFSSSFFPLSICFILDSSIAVTFSALILSSAMSNLQSSPSGMVFSLSLQVVHASVCSDQCAAEYLRRVLCTSLSFPFWAAFSLVICARNHSHIGLCGDHLLRLVSSTQG